MHENLPSSRPWLRQYPEGLAVDPQPAGRSVVDLFEAAVRRWPDRPFLDFYGRAWTYAEVAAVVERVAAGMRLHGIGPGRRVGILLPNSPYYVITLFAALRCGATIVHFSTLLAEREIAVQLHDSGTEMLVTLDVPQLLDRCVGVFRASHLHHVFVCSLLAGMPVRKRLMARMRAEPACAPWRQDELLVPWEQLLVGGPAPTLELTDPAREPAAILYTAGTTGRPRGAVLSHRNLAANAEQNRLWFGAAEPGEERLVAILPFFHAFGLTAVLLFAVTIGAQLVLLPRFEPERFLRMLRRKRPTFLAGVPTLFNALLDLPGVQPQDFASLKVCVSGGEALATTLRQRFEGFTGVPLTQGYGLTECSPVVACGNPLQHLDRPGSVGLPLPGTDVAIRDAGGLPLAAGEVGEIWVRGPQVMLGYAGRPDETAAALQDGWLRTGDLGRLDADGYLYVVDRLGDVIVTSGYKVYPHRIEEALLGYPAIGEALVVAEPDHRAGAVPVAHLVLRPGRSLDETALLLHLAPLLSRPETPRRFVVHASLPRTPMGKVRHVRPPADGQDGPSERM